MINYLGYKFLLFCKVSTQPRRSSARWVCARETEQPSPPQMLLMVGAREGEGGELQRAGGVGRGPGPMARSKGGEGHQGT